MTDEEFEFWLLHQNFPEEVKNIIRYNRNAPPGRSVRSSGKNVTVKLASPKNGETIPCESQHEMACMLKLERDSDVLEFRSQRPIYTAYYKNKSGKIAGHQKTNDLFVIRRNSVELIECKPEKILQKLFEKNPDLFVKDNDIWRCPPGEQYAKQNGFSFHVFSSSSVNWRFQRNASFLYDYFVDDPPPVSSEVAEHIISVIRAEPGITLHKLLNLKEHFNPDDVYILIATNQIYVDLDRDLLVDAPETYLFADEDTAKSVIVRPRPKSPHLMDHHAIDVEIGKKVKLNETEWTIVGTGPANIMLCAGNGAIFKPSKAAFEELVKQGEVIGCNLISQQSEADKKLDEFYKRASEKEWNILASRQSALGALISYKEEGT